jgi:hypothetical protein
MLLFKLSIRPSTESGRANHAPAEAVEHGGGGVPLSPAPKGDHNCCGVVFATVQQSLRKEGGFILSIANQAWISPCKYENDKNVLLREKKLHFFQCRTVQLRCFLQGCGSGNPYSGSGSWIRCLFYPGIQDG